MPKYDVFISYPNTDEDGHRLKEAELAEKLYNILTKKGLPVFFSDKSLFEQGIGDYKKAIDKALGEASVLIVLGTDINNITKGWVEHEYETFYEDILSRRKPNGKIMSYIDNIHISQMPRTLQRFQIFFMEQCTLEKLAEYIMNAFKEQPADSAKGKAAPVLTGGEITLSKAKGVDQNTFTVSSYRSDYRNELNRLKIQSDNARRSDKIALDHLYSLEPWDRDEPLYVLDVGSAYGFVAEDRFGNDPRVAKVLCLDNNRRVIERAQILFAENDKIVFEVADVDSETFEEDVRELMYKHGIPKFHIVYSALLLLHLKDPCRTLRKLRSLMDKDSYIVVRGSDDGSKLCYPHYELMEQIIEKGMTVKNCADRRNGSKLFHQMINSGFSDVRVFSCMTETSGMSFEEKQQLFSESFAYRSDAYRMILEKDPESETAKKDYEWITNALEEFENYFYECGFWYCEYDYMAVAGRFPHK
ncbi:MAG: methyltransferase domain-containing protein [Ruminococcus sp.]|nr:methyltransferase domain-containing protein [Ruminococcus sp.]